MTPQCDIHKLYSLHLNTTLVINTISTRVLKKREKDNEGPLNLELEFHMNQEIYKNWFIFIEKKRRKQKDFRALKEA